MGSTSLEFKENDKLTGSDDFHPWKMILDLKLEDHDLLDHVKGRIQEPPSNASAAVRNKYKKGEIKAKLLIRESINKSLVAYISELGTSKEMYDKLILMFQVNNVNQVLFLKNKLKNMKKGRDESVQTFFLKLTETRNHLLAIGEIIADREMVLTALGGLPYEWQVFTTTILNNNTIPNFDELLSRCMQEETRMKEFDNERNAAYGAHSRKKNSGGSKDKRRTKTQEKKGKCFTCHRPGHYARECPFKKDSPDGDDNNNNRRNGNRRNDKSKGKRKAHFGGNNQPSKRSRNTRYEESNVVDKRNEYILVSALSAASLPDTMDVWLIDSGASRHITGFKEALSDMVERDTNLEIILGDNATYPVKGTGTVTLHLSQGQVLRLQDVLYVPKLKKNLVSVSAMEDKGFNVTFSNGKVLMWKKSFKEAISIGSRVGTLYQVGGSPLGAMTCDTIRQTELWHRRFGKPFPKQGRCM